MAQLRTKPASYFNFDPLRFSLPPPRRITEDRRAMIAKAAYFRAQQRNFEPGHELEDWLAAEREVDQRLAARPSPGQSSGNRPIR